ncbi:HEAT repeat domain-containing protein [Corallococcus macrosporus]|uniref:HEAT repeat domain-containing protein n=1 Tax=Corallococcus macrosporus TaxID=35 RepID=A0ABS3D8P4_9BACT|nr:HEAT repeat domain-containing protein [Corallococcus macrosporus]MBN8227027.1 HEAT repeat domain-containing protein [Corallococcus macrosporus]
MNPEELRHPEFGAIQLEASYQEAAVLLETPLPGRGRRSPRPFQSSFRDPLGFALYRAPLARPRVHALLLNRDPARVFYTAQPGEPLPSDDALQDTAVLVRRFLDIPLPRWALSRQAPGPSKMAALFLRALLEQWPEAVRCFQPEVSGGMSEGLDIGITGELDAEGQAVAVDGLDDKVRRFFELYPSGVLLVPATQWTEASRLVGGDAPRPRLGRRQRRRVEPFRGVLDLLVRLRVPAESCPETRLFEALREGARKVTCWNGAVREVSALIERSFLPAEEYKSGDEALVIGEDETGLILETRHEYFSGRKRPLFIEGGPGDGKSMVLSRLTARLLVESPLLGPALRVDARPLVSAGFSLAKALATPPKPGLDEAGYARLIELARGPTLMGSVSLAVDGLDEVSPADRRRILGFLDDWPGPVLVGARPLPDDAPGASHVRVRPLSRHDQEALFALEGKPHYAKLVLQDENTRYTEPVDRRKQMFADLCSTPLGISLLAMLPEPMLGESLDVPQVLKACIIRLLQRAEDNERITKQVRRRVENQGLAVLGAAAWSMIRRGGAVLDSEAMEAMTALAQPDLLDALYEVIETSDLVQRTGPGRSQFSHKSLAEFCAALYLSGQKGSEPELLAQVGEPGPDAVAFHFGALVSSRERLTRFILDLSRNSHRPMSSLALATRLLIANGAERVSVDAALAVLTRRVRLASRLDSNSRQGGLDDDREMWLALSRWAPELRPHASVLVDACLPLVGRFLRGELPPLTKANTDGYLLRWRVDGPFRACAFAEKLALALGLHDLPLPVLTRLEEGEALLRRRPAGAWVMELETLFDAPDDATRGSPSTVALSVWSQLAPSSRHLQRLDVLSQGSLAVMGPVISTVAGKGTLEQKREALLRAAVNSLEFGYVLRGEWHPRIRFSGKTHGIPAERWLEQWEHLWDVGLVGDTSRRSKPLEALYAEFLNDPCGPARWRALVARARMNKKGDAALFRTAVRDRHRAVRIEALARIRRHRLRVEPTAIATSLSSLDDDERWMALASIGAASTLPIDLVVAGLARNTPQPPEVDMPSPGNRWRAQERPWEKAMRKHGEAARAELIGGLRARMEGEAGVRTYFELIDGPYRDVALEVFPQWGISASQTVRSMLATGSPRQRRTAAKLLEGHHEALAPYVDDAEPEIASLAQNAVQRHQFLAPFRAGPPARMPTESQPLDDFHSRYARPILTPQVLSRYDSFEECWAALATHIFMGLPSTQPSFNLRASAWEPDRQAKELLQRLLLLYRPGHQALVLDGLMDEERARVAVFILRQAPPVGAVLALMSRGGALLEAAVAVLRGTPHGAQGAQQLCEMLCAATERRELSSSWARMLAELDGIAAFFPLLEPGAPRTLRDEAISFIRSKWEPLEELTTPRQDVMERARALETSTKTRVREIALRVLSLSGTSGDAERGRLRLKQAEAPLVRAAAVHLVGRLGNSQDLPMLRALLTGTPEVAGEAAIAMARLGGTSVVEELLRLVESPPRGLERARWRKGRWNGPWRDWHLAVAEAVIRGGDGEQARRLAFALVDDDDVWDVAREHFRLPEHLLFVAGPLSRQELLSEDSFHAELSDDLDKVLEGLNPEAARRVMLEAALRGEPFSKSFEDRIKVIRPEDLDLLLPRLRAQPDDALALRWVGQLPSGEAVIDALWRELSVQWWGQ